MIAERSSLLELPEHVPKRFSQSAMPQEAGEIILREYGVQVAIEFPTPKTEGQWQLTSRGWVGYIPLTSEIGLYLSPKVPLRNLFGMLEYAYRLKSLRFIDGSVSCSSIEEFYEQIARLLAWQVLGRGMKGFYHSYHPKSEQIPYVCGRLNIQRACQRPWDCNLECHYEEFTSDIEDNQILAWTLHRILLTGICKGSSHSVIRLAYKTVQGSASMKPFGPKACIKRLYNRLNQDYAGMHALCRFFLENSGPQCGIGDHTMIPFLVDMDRLFELFVAEWLRVHLPPGLSIKSQEVISLDQNRTIVFKIDLVLYDDERRRPLCVLDTKYKSPESPSNPDIYQAVSYAVAKECPLAVLIYPAPLAMPVDVLVGPAGDIRVKSLVFDLDGDLDLSGGKFVQDLLSLQTRIADPGGPEGAEHDWGEIHIPGEPWNEKTLFHELSKRGSVETEVARKIFNWAKDNLPRFTWGNGKNKGSFFPVLDHKGESYWPISISTYGNVGHNLLFQ